MLSLGTLKLELQWHEWDNVVLLHMHTEKGDELDVGLAVRLSSEIGYTDVIDKSTDLPAGTFILMTVR